MHINVIGSNMEVGKSLTSYVEEHITKAVTKYFDKAINSEVHFSKENHFFKAIIVVNEGVKGGISVKSDALAGDVYGCFNEAVAKIAKQLKKYKERIKDYRRRRGGGLKSIEPSYEFFMAPKYVLPPLEYDVFEEMESEEQKINLAANENINIINEKTTDIEELMVNEAIMKMDLANLPALVFINKSNQRLNVVYYRKDGNISWIDPKMKP
jgi:ribosomal subunit interface protein